MHVIVVSYTAIIMYNNIIFVSVLNLFWQKLTIETLIRVFYAANNMIYYIDIGCQDAMQYI